MVSRSTTLCEKHSAARSVAPCFTAPTAMAERVAGRVRRSPDPAGPEEPALAPGSHDSTSTVAPTVTRAAPAGMAFAQSDMTDPRRVVPAGFAPAVSTRTHLRPARRDALQQ